MPKFSLTDWVYVIRLKLILTPPKNIIKLIATLDSEKSCNILAERWIDTIGEVNTIINMQCLKADIRCKLGGRCRQNTYSLIAEYTGKENSPPVKLFSFLFYKKGARNINNADRTLTDRSGNYYRRPSAGKVSSSDEISEILKNLKSVNENMLVDIVNHDNRYVLYYLAIEKKRLLFMPFRKTSALSKNQLAKLKEKMQERNIDFLGVGNLNKGVHSREDANVFFLDNRNYPVFKRKCTTYKIGKDFETGDEAFRLGNKIVKFVKSIHKFKKEIEAYEHLFSEDPTFRGYDSCRVCYSWFVE